MVKDDVQLLVHLYIPSKSWITGITTLCLCGICDEPTDLCTQGKHCPLSDIRRPPQNYISWILCHQKKEVIHPILLLGSIQISLFSFILDCISQSSHLSRSLSDFVFLSSVIRKVLPFYYCAQIEKMMNTFSGWNPEHFCD